MDLTQSFVVNMTTTIRTVFVDMKGAQDVILSCLTYLQNAELNTF